MLVEPQCLRDKRAALKKDNKRPGLNLPAISRREIELVKHLKCHEGHVMASFDFVSLEPSVSAAWSNDPMYKYATFEGIGKKPYLSHDGVLMLDDIYLMTASQLPMFKDPLLETFEKYKLYDAWMDPEYPDHDRVKKHKEIKKMRDISKTACLGLERGMGVDKLCLDVRAKSGYEMTRQEGQLVKDTFWGFYEGLKDLNNGLTSLVKKQGYFITRPFGFKVNCTPHKAYAFFTQAQASGVIEVMAMKLFAIAPYVKFLALIHDEIIVTFPKEMVEQFRIDLYRCLDSLNEDLKWSVPMRVGLEIGNNFGEMK